MKTLLVMLLVLSSCKGAGGSAANIYPEPARPTIPSANLSAVEQVEEPLLQPYVDEFYNLKAEADISDDGHRVFYKLKNLSGYGNVIGRCEYYNNANIVYVDTNFFATASSMDIKSVIFHELGHCDLGRNHRTIYWQGTSAYYDGIKPNWGNYTRYLSDGITPNPNYRGEWPLSLMHRSIVRENRFGVETEYYLYELFHQGLSEIPVTGNSSMNDSLNCEAHQELDGSIHFE